MSRKFKLPTQRTRGKTQRWSINPKLYEKNSPLERENIVKVAHPTSCNNIHNLENQEDTEDNLKNKIFIEKNGIKYFSEGYLFCKVTIAKAETLKKVLKELNKLSYNGKIIMDLEELTQKLMEMTE